MVLNGIHPFALSIGRKRHFLEYFWEQLENQRAGEEERLEELKNNVLKAIGQVKTGAAPAGAHREFT